jgi:glycolate oxidase iron-sulfur subunit
MRAILQDGVLPPRDQAEAESILRACVHCGFCNATCPSYQILGDERDGPRGRIYLMKHMLEGGAMSDLTQLHLDRCLGCRACETTCPSGVQYTRLLELTRPAVAERAPRPVFQRLLRWALRTVIPRPALFSPLLGLGRLVRPLLPHFLRRIVPQRPATHYRTEPVSMPRAGAGLLPGCVQDVAAPQINKAAEALLARMGIALLRQGGTGCCGAMALHMGAMDEARQAARRNVDAWFPLLERGDISHVFSASSGCTQVLKDYGHLLQGDLAYAQRAQRVAEAVRDASEYLSAEVVGRLAAAGPGAQGQRVAWQCPCSLQHGLKGQGRVEALLAAAGYTLTPVREGHLCCGSAGTYSLLQPTVSEALLQRKLAGLESPDVSVIATANIGCQLHLAKASERPVRHWLELVADAAGCRAS